MTDKKKMFDLMEDVKEATRIYWNRAVPGKDMAGIAKIVGEKIDGIRAIDYEEEVVENSAHTLAKIMKKEIKKIVTEDAKWEYELQQADKILKELEEKKVQLESLAEHPESTYNTTLFRNVIKDEIPVLFSDLKEMIDENRELVPAIEELKQTLNKLLAEIRKMER